MDAIEAEWVMVDYDVASEGEKLAAGQHFRAMLLEDVERAELWTRRYANVKHGEAMVSGWLKALDVLKERSRSCAETFPMLDGWDDLDSRIAKAREQWRSMRL